MRNFAASVLDFYDDGGKILQEVVPNIEDVPDFVKTAAAVGKSDNPQMFALVMVDNGEVMKKYATADKGNTWLSTLYFWQTRDSLPEEAQKVAAANLIEACEAYDIAPPDFLFEHATQGPVDTNMVDVTGKRPHPIAAPVEQEKTAQVYAIERNGVQSHPIRVETVKTAAEYFERNVQELQPKERRSYAVKLAHVARQAAIEMPEIVEEYASSTYGPLVEGHIDTRHTHLIDSDAPAEVRAELVKLAQARRGMSPLQFAADLESFDRKHGLDELWDRWVSDPYYSTFGLEKMASETESHTIGEVTVTNDELHKLARNGIPTVRTQFGDATALAFQKEPIAVFTSLPLPQRKLFARMATTFADGA